MKPEEFKLNLKSSGITPTGFARAYGLHRYTAMGWARDKKPAKWAAALSKDIAASPELQAIIKLRAKKVK
jgi:hypothetical protein